MNKQSEFKNYHPIVNFVYFSAVIILSMIFMNPVCLTISLTMGLIYSVILNGRSTIRFNIRYILPIMFISALINPVFNHEGTTVLAYFPNGSPLTLESVIYGIASAFMLAAVISWFSCFNVIITSDKFMYLFGKAIPSLSLVFSMVLRYVPKFKAQFKEVSNAQKCIGMDEQGGFKTKLKNSIRILSAMLTWSLENSVETADSMKSRGYGLKGRTAFSNYRFDMRDSLMLLWILFLTAYIICANISEWLNFSYFPSFGHINTTPRALSGYVVYLILFATPVIIEEVEAFRWKKLKSKI